MTAAATLAITWLMDGSEESASKFVAALEIVKAENPADAAVVGMFGEWTVTY